MISTLNQSLVSRLIATAVFFLFLSTPLGPVGAQPYDPDDEIDQTVARISFIQGPVSYGRGDDPDDWDPALVNVPFTLGDRIYSSADGRAELQLPGGNFIRIGRRSYLTALTLTYDTKQFYLGNGAATVNIRRLESDDVFEIDTPNVAVTLDAPGRYRVEVDEDGNTRVIVRDGRAIVAANGRQITVERAEMRIYGIDRPEYELAGLRGADAFDRWVDEREDRYERAYRTAYQYADEEIIGVDDLAGYGRWEEIPEYGPAWTPTQVAVGWQPFTVGHWFWQDPWGWTWISEEAWGWAPCHYGRWTYYRSRWYWVPVRRRVEVVRYAPAVVEIVQFRDHVGWFPLHPRDRFVPWWGRRGRVEEVTYVNRTRVVIVTETTFVSSRRVTTNIVRDTTIIRESTTVRVRERMPIPRRESIRVLADSRNVQRPPANIIARPIVVRTAPTPPPPRFDEKLRVIRERKGEALTSKEMVELGAKDFKSNRRIQFKPAAAGRGEFVARGQGASAPASQPVTSLKGRKLATQEEPVVTDLPRKQQREQQRRELQVQEQQKNQGGDQKQLEQEKQKQQKQLQDQQRKDQRDQEDQKRDLERKQQEQDRLKKDQDRDRQKDQKQFQEQQKKDQEQDRRDLERKQQEQERLRKQQEQEKQKQDRQLEDQKRKNQEQQQRDLERKQQEQERLQKQQEQERQKQQKQLEEQKRKAEQQRDDQQRQDLERKKDLERERQKQEKQLQDQKRKEDLRDRKERDEDQRKEKERQQLEQGRQKQPEDQQRGALQRQELERQRLEKQPQDQARKEEDKQGRGPDRQREQDLREAARQKQLEERKQQQRRKEQPPADETPRGRGDRDAPPPAGPPPPGPPPR
jgi:uncharacterized protein DUF6600/FecR-like protein